MELAQTSSAAPGTTGDLSNVKLPTRRDIDAVISPYVVRRMSAGTAEWRAVVDKLARKERRRRRKSQLRRLFGGLRHPRPERLVIEHYESHWAKLPWPCTHGVPANSEAPVPCVWADEGLFVRRYGRKRAHHLVFARIVEALQPGTALEVGFGNGINLLTMPTLFPSVAWSGVELTAAGVAVARSVQQEPELPEILRDFLPMPIVDPAAHRNVSLQQGNATSLPFPDKSFDLVFTFQAVEQMQAVRDAALREIARVARRHVVLTEPLTDFNHDPVQRDYRSRRGYLELHTTEIPVFGMRPQIVFSDMPQKLTLGVGVVVAEVAG